MNAILLRDSVMDENGDGNPAEAVACIEVPEVADPNAFYDRIDQLWDDHLAAGHAPESFPQTLAQNGFVVFDTPPTYFLSPEESWKRYEKSTPASVAR